jgi:hypothetical protein
MNLERPKPWNWFKHEDSADTAVAAGVVAANASYSKSHSTRFMPTVTSTARLPGLIAMQGGGSRAGV